MLTVTNEELRTVPLMSYPCRECPHRVSNRDSNVTEEVANLYRPHRCHMVLKAQCAANPETIDYDLAVLGELA